MTAELVVLATEYVRSNIQQQFDLRATKSTLYLLSAWHGRNLLKERKA
jgi:hypothetical protein